MTSELYEILKHSWRGQTIIEYITNLEVQLEAQTKARITAETCLQETKNEIKRLQTEQTHT